MRLQRQLLFVSLLLLSLPWAGCQYIREIESALRAGQSQSLAATAEAIATAMATDEQLIYPYPERMLDGSQNHDNLYFHTTDIPIIVDGYNNEWLSIPLQKMGDDNDPFQVSYRSALYQDTLYLFFEVRDNNIVYHNPSRSILGNGDRIVLVNAKGRHFVLATSAPGSLSAHYLKSRDYAKEEPAIKGQWQDSAEGYNVELSLPLSLAKGRLGFYVIDKHNDQSERWLGNATPQTTLPPWMIYPPKPLQEKLAIFDKPGLRLTLTDSQQWQLANIGSINKQQSTEVHWLVQTLYRAILKTQLSESIPDEKPGKLTRSEVNAALQSQTTGYWYQHPDFSNQSILSVAAPVTADQGVIATIVAEQSSEQFLALTDSAFNRLLLYSLVSLGVTGIGLLGYASWLSWRVRRLSRAAENILEEDGTISDTFPSSNMKDEIGDLTRSYNELLSRIREYTEYLRTLSRKLSHELRTPLAIVHSSLDNLEQQHLDDNSQTYHQRAKEGAARLSHILSAMSEASRVEESIQSAELELFDPQPMLDDITRAYQDVYTSHHILFNCPEKAATIYAVPELLVQMLDKLFDNAADFCPPQGRIQLDYNVTDKFVEIRISNEGPLLPEKMAHQLFDNMVSMREKDTGDNSTHLGLGLHIVRLIVEYHRGHIKASNLADSSGVCFIITLPAADHA